MEILLEPLVKILFIGVGYIVGFVPIFFGSLGAIEPGPVHHCVDGGKYYRSMGMKFWHITYTDGENRYLPAETVALVGWLLIAALATGIYALSTIAG